jgi:hypothetical protein
MSRLPGHSNPILARGLSRTATPVKRPGIAILAMLLAGNASATEVQVLLQKADAFRLTPGAAQVLTRIEVRKKGQLDKQRDYLVYVKPGRRSLVLSRSPVEKGQKVLMLGDDFWIVLPSSQRPIRITPAQKLLGDAATGDIATMTWAEDYDGTLAGQSEVEGVPCWRLDLTAQRHGVTYQRIELYLARSDGHPVQADLYLASEKLAKRASFAIGVVDGKPLVTAMTLQDRIQTDRETVIRYLARSPRSIGDEFYNPMFLTRHEPD